MKVIKLNSTIFHIFLKKGVFVLLIILLSHNLLGQSGNLDPSITPRYGTVNLSEGFDTDPYTVTVSSEGAIDVSLIGICPGCRGFASSSPDLIINWTGSSEHLRVFFEAEESDRDATLIIQAPNGSWIGNDDAYSGSRNPMIDLRSFGAGRYAVWVASYRASDRIRGKLTVTEENKKPIGENGTTLELDVPFVPTTLEVVNAMLDVTHVGPGDYVIDLGSGDGRIVIGAAKRGAFGHGIDLNPVRIREAEENAEQAGVSDKVIFIEGDLFDADFSKATVVTMYLLSSVNLRLRPVLLERLRPGTRVVSHAFTMGDWKNDEHHVVEGRNVYFWIIPANARGMWTWNTKGSEFQMEVSQEYQNISVNIVSSNHNLLVRKSLLKGERICLTAVDETNNRQYVFSGRIEGNQISGMAQIRDGNVRAIETWTATLVTR
ncbi:MAG: class I SAM-dependent methyltransferase [Bacteroidales bacterium]|nr:class I SAM-dependent methyltransferase [Bacteroidales bacterium]